MTDWSLGWPAPAKLNLMLRILGRRPDGYHDLQTVFQFIDREDSLDFRVRPDGRVKRLTPLDGVPEHADLVVRAANLLKQHLGIPLGADIRITKCLPMGGGLGGGSSDAATTLVALNRLWKGGLDVRALSGLGVKLGADVPVFLGGTAAWAEGVGERLVPLKLPEPWFLVVVPPCHVSTAEIFQHPDLTRDSSPITIRAFLAGDTQNDCLPLVRKRHHEVAQALDWLDQYAPARLTGTGACVFASFPSESDARAVEKVLPDGWLGFVALGRNQSALLKRLEKQSQ